MLKVAVVDDEEDVALNTAEFIRRYGEENGREFEIKIYHDGMDIVSLSELPDIIFLDIEMKNLDGMRAAKEIRKRDENCVILFVTRMAQYAVEGYEVNALDFIVKPFTRQSFFYKFGRAVKAATRTSKGPFWFLPTAESTNFSFRTYSMSRSSTIRCSIIWSAALSRYGTALKACAKSWDRAALPCAMPATL